MLAFSCPLPTFHHPNNTSSFPSRPDSSPKAVEQALADDELELEVDELEPKFEIEPPAEDYEDLTVTVLSTLNPSTANTQPVVVTLQATPQMSNPDMRLVYQRLGDLQRFNNNGDPMTKAEY
ncbi:hypothetical protein RhiJN_07874 [Ceratobasidium sp. AG-Ba]|nr:hypothetical protein RhiJN_07874 [Ceratobasidium sp. AG-Ba]